MGTKGHLPISYHIVSIGSYREFLGVRDNPHGWRSGGRGSARVLGEGSYHQHLWHTERCLRKGRPWYVVVVLVVVVLVVVVVVVAAAVIVEVVNGSGGGGGGDDSSTWY